MMRDKIKLSDQVSCSAGYGSGMAEGLGLHGYYVVECRDADGNLKWVDDIHNTVVTVGQNLALDTILAGSAYTVTGPFMGLISGGSFSAIAAADTMASHAGWLEAGNAHAPTYTVGGSGVRATLAFSAASAGSKSLSANPVFTMTSGSALVIKGAFVAFGTGAVSTIDSTAGTLLSAGLFSGGDKTVSSGDTLTISYTMSG